MTWSEISTETLRRMTRWVSALGLSFVVGSSIAEASTAEERAMADALFREAKALMQQKAFPEACRKLEESQRLDPRDGTLLNLAVCHEEEGKIATAWVEFQEALAAARRAKRWDRISLANRHLKGLKDKIPNLTIEVAPGAAVEGFELRRNGVLIAEPVWGTPVPVDPGEHSLEAVAPERLPWQSTFEVLVGEEKTVVVPVLEEKPKPPPPKPKPKPAPKPKPPPPESRRPAAYIAGGAGVLAIGVGTYFGLRAISKSNESDDHCRGTLCDQTGLDRNDEAKNAATISNIAFGLGVIGVGVGTYLWVTEPSTSDGVEVDEVGVTPVAGPGQAAIVMRGRW